MRKFQILAHTADVRFKLQGDTLVELFTAGLEAIGSLLGKNACQNRDVFAIKENFSLVGQDTTALLVDFLSEVVSRSYVNKTIYCKVIFSDLTARSLTVQLAGIAVDHFDQDIKAVTYHEANVIKNNQGIYETTIVLDI